MPGIVEPMGPPGMWIGLIAGLTVAAVLLGLRFVRASAPGRLPPPASADTPAAPVAAVTSGG